MADAPPNDLVPVTPKTGTPPPDVPGGGKAPPADLIAVKKDPAAGAAIPPAPPPGVVHQAVQPALNILPDIIDDMKKGFETSKHAVSRAGQPGMAGFGTGPEAAAGALQVIGAPVTGTARALAGDPARAVFPQDTVFGQLAANTVETAAAMFGPSAIGEATSILSKAAKEAGPVKKLMDGGVQLTLGQISGKYAKRMEEAAKSVPILGSFIRGAEARTLDSFNVATANKALARGGLSVEAKNGREAIQKGQQALNEKYAEVRKDIPAVHKDSMFDADISRLWMTLDEMDPSIAKRVEAVMTNRVYAKFGDIGAMDGAKFKQAESELTTIATSAKSSADEAERQFGYKVDEIREALRHAVERQYPAIAPKLREVNAAFAAFADVERASSLSAQSGGRFTPGQYLTSIKRADKSPRDKQFAAGNMVMQDWAETAHEVIGNKLPDSGTAERMAWHSWDLGGGAAAAHYDPTGMAIPGIIGGSAIYSGPGQAATNAAVREAPYVSKAVRDLTAKSGPAAGVAETLDQGQ